jgi:hypothetical protein
LKVGTWGKPLWAFFSEARFAGGGTGTGTRCGSWGCAVRATGISRPRVRERIRRVIDRGGLPVMSLIIPKGILLSVQFNWKNHTTYKGTSRHGLILRGGTFPESQIVCTVRN